MTILIALIVAVFLFGWKKGFTYVFGALFVFFGILALAAGALWFLFSL
jgi:hypothetical protein